MLSVGSLFSGIEGFGLGFERAGMRVAWHAESDPFCRAVIRRHWPHTVCFHDVRDIHDCEPVDVLAGGFPCPVVSQVARGRNTAPWLWPEFFRVVRHLRPRYVVVENVEGLLYAGRGFGDILGDLASCGFDAEWRVLRASDFGAPHHRARVWLVGYPHSDREPDLSLDAEAPRLPQLHGAVRGWPDPPVGVGVADGLPNRLDRLGALGNALVPTIAEFIGQRIVAHASQERLAA